MPIETFLWARRRNSGFGVGKRGPLNAVGASVSEDPKMDMEVYSIENVSPFNIYFSATSVRSAPEQTSISKMKPFYGWALLDSGASSCFIHPRIVKEYHIPVVKKTKPKKLKVIDGRDISSGLVTHECTFNLELGSHKEQIKCNVAEIGRHSLVLGMS